MPKLAGCFTRVEFAVKPEKLQKPPRTNSDPDPHAPLLPQQEIGGWLWQESRLEIMAA